jgi:hypothetical protein
MEVTCLTVPVEGRSDGILPTMITQEYISLCGIEHRAAKLNRPAAPFVSLLSA